ncbi:MAG: hypothetical protein BMS9Abin29_2278 [Gemmatimonadota bacterium]|nr:MAG: hypothetical protein BMS9Abin29_2278 [Gemmatimonadota bacterium]
MGSPIRPTAPHGDPMVVSHEPAGLRTDTGLRRRYHDYCQRQAAGLLRLIPQEAIRPLYRTARAWAAARGLHENKDPMATLVRYCRGLLPLPPFERWLEDYEQHRIAHLRYVSEGPLHARAVDPVVVDAREVRMDGERWTARLSLFPDGDVWRGFIGFVREPSGTGVRTANVFCDEDPKNIRDRFTDLTFHTLQAFLRSTLP